MNSRYYHGWYGPYGTRPGVQRDDNEIKADVLTALEDDPRLDPSALVVRVEDGVVTLSGEVDTSLTKQAAEDAAWNAPGIVDVHNNLLLSEE